MSGKRVFKHLSGTVTASGSTNVSLNPPAGYLYSVIYASISLTSSATSGGRQCNINAVVEGNGTGEVAQTYTVVFTGNQTTTSSNFACFSSGWYSTNSSGGTSRLFTGPLIVWPTLSAGTGQTGLFFTALLVSGDSAAYDVLVEVIPYSEG